MRTRHFVFLFVIIGCIGALMMSMVIPALRNITRMGAFGTAVGGLSILVMTIAHLILLPRQHRMLNGLFLSGLMLFAAGAVYFTDASGGALVALVFFGVLMMLGMTIYGLANALTANRRINQAQNETDEGPEAW